MTHVIDGPRSTHRATWRAVAVPREHGGWGLTLEPVLLGLLAAWSWPALAIGIAALGLFLVRTPAKLVAIDVRRRQWRARSHLAARIAVLESAVVIALAATAAVVADPRWLVPVALAAPLVAVELWYDVRSRSRRLLPELCGALGISASSAAIVLASGGEWGLGLSVWLVLAARSIASVSFVRAQVLLLHRGVNATFGSDVGQLVGIAAAAAAVVLDRRAWLGAIAVLGITATQAWWSRRPPAPVKVIGFRQMGLGLALVFATTVGIWIR